MMNGTMISMMTKTRRMITIRYAHITPNSFNEDADEHNDLHLLLYHWCLESEEYRNFYKDSVKYKILDNSYYELRIPPKADELLKQAVLIGADEVVAPDVMHNRRETIGKLTMFLSKSKNFKFKVNAVVCGDSKAELMECFRYYLTHPNVDVISFSRRGCRVDGEFHDDTRFELVNRASQWMKQKGIFKPIHLLGANGISDYYRHWPDEVRSIDSKQFATAVLGKWKLDTESTKIDRECFEYIVSKLKTRHNK